MLKRKQRHYPKIFACTFPSAENVSCETRVCLRVRCFTWNIDRPEKVSRETVPPCFAPMFHVEQFRHLFHAFVSHETKVPSLRMAPETVEKLSFFRQSVFWLRKTRTSESSHTETFSLLKYENRGTRPRLLSLNICLRIEAYGLMRLHSKRFWMRAAARQLFWREIRLYRQTEVPSLRMAPI